MGISRDQSNTKGMRFKTNKCQALYCYGKPAKKSLRCKLHANALLCTVCNVPIGLGLYCDNHSPTSKQVPWPPPPEAGKNPATDSFWQVGNGDGSMLVRPDPKGDPFERMMKDVPPLPLYDVQGAYGTLKAVLMAALDQASQGKGRERHATPGERFEDQQIVQLGEWLGSTHGTIFQAAKKAIESTRLDDAAAKRELLGAIVYLAAAVVQLDRKSSPKA